jgi:dynein heavy chain
LKAIGLNKYSNSKCINNGISLLPLDDMMEILDANSLDLMGMKAQGKYVEFFIKTVEDWREKLGRVDAVVNEWLKVQKNWRILVNIFVGSDDIRQQLPEDTKVFETVHG